MAKSKEAELDDFDFDDELDFDFDGPSEPGEDVEEDSRKPIQKAFKGIPQWG
jgi:hypothetical protein